MALRGLVFADIEASGLQFLSYPIEIGWAWVENGQVEARSLLVRPTPEWLSWKTGWSPEAENLHGIKLDELMCKGMEPTDVCEALNQELADAEVVFDTGADAYDARWLSILYRAVAATPAFLIAESPSDICILVYAEILQVPNNVVRALDAHAPKTTHRAATDAAHWAWWQAALRAIAGEGVSSPAQAAEIAQAITVHFA